MTATDAPPASAQKAMRQSSSSQITTETASLRNVHTLFNLNPQGSAPVGLERQVFDHYDTNHSGGLDREELKVLLHDLFEIALLEAEQKHASTAWVAQARQQLESDYGRETFAAAADELLALRDTNHNGSLEFDEIRAALDIEHTKAASRGRFWRLAPLCDLPVDMDRLTNGPYFKLKVFAAGGIAGLVAKTSASPLARITILMQTGGIPGVKRDPFSIINHILKSEGTRGLFRGNTADIMRMVPYSGIQYVAYESLKVKFLNDTNFGELPSKMLAGGCAGMIGIFSTYPLDVVRARLCVQVAGQERYKNVVHAFRTIANEEGVRGLYRGCATAMTERFPNMAVNYGTYDSLRTECSNRGYTGLPVSLLCGGVAGWVSTIMTFPFDLVMRNQQISGVPTGPLQVAGHIFRTEGVSGFYSGLAPQLAKAIPYTCVAWAVYDQCKKLMHFEVK